MSLICTMFEVFVCTRLICARIHLRNSRMSLAADIARSDLAIVGSFAYGGQRHDQLTIYVDRDELLGAEGSAAVAAAILAGWFAQERKGVDKAHGYFRRSGYQNPWAMCLVDYQEKDVLRILPFCRHTFHVVCVDIWLKQHSTCPACRISLRDSPDRKRLMEPSTAQLQDPFLHQKLLFRIHASLSSQTPVFLLVEET
ncbi:hypothetical protein ZIOFF_063401 [Zingiber officinale]|uniref:RING-type domain-containing protein n=1 Tax=Zingiber officinale TaxID=94328 RepID=A0A8J5F4X9_ZINOF|nr:hypothetical protein ZIOFF_063401 [Zingiber officinale]